MHAKNSVLPQSITINVNPAKETNLVSQTKENKPGPDAIQCAPQKTQNQIFPNLSYGLSEPFTARNTHYEKLSDQYMHNGLFDRKLIFDRKYQSQDNTLMPGYIAESHADLATTNQLTKEGAISMPANQDAVAVFSKNNIPSIIEMESSYNQPMPVLPGNIVFK